MCWELKLSLLQITSFVLDRVDTNFFCYVTNKIKTPFFFSSLERQESVATTEARLRMEGVELKEEWQDEDFPRYCTRDTHTLITVLGHVT